MVEVIDGACTLRRHGNGSVFDTESAPAAVMDSATRVVNVFRTSAPEFKTGDK